MTILIEIIGWTGALAVIIAYFLVSLNKVKSASYLYQILNLVGAILLIINTAYLKAYPSAFVNVVWVGIATYSIIKNKNS
ncbi:MAG TPA: hypothetical protein VF691_06880 [Cytophagaceae bacterium]|jgi:peptidoglycan/LPS O-acetylase OafA/YrhL